MPQLEAFWSQVEGSVASSEHLSLFYSCLYMVLAGVLALYIRLLYRICSGSPSDTESLSRVFPLLALVTTGVIAVVKSSLALSLGLVGALSIVRFRAAIKDPEELVYLFLCIAVGLAFGAEQPVLGFVLVAVVTLFVVGMHLTSRRHRQHRLLLTISGDSQRYFSDSKQGALAAVDAVVKKYTLQRFDVENGRGQLRVVLGQSNARRTAELVARLRERLPDCDLSYVNLNSTL